MSGKKRRAGFNLTEIDVQAMRDLQNGLGQHTRLLAASSAFDQITKELKQFEDLQWNGFHQLEDQFAATRGIQDWVERERRRVDQFSGYDEILKPYPEAAALMADSLRDAQAAINAITFPFEPNFMSEMLGRLSPAIQIEEYLGLFDFRRLQGYVENFDVEYEGEDLAENTEADDGVSFEASLHIQCISAISDALIEYFHRHPQEMRTMQPRLFEELVAELIKDQGFEVELTQQTRDGGYDIVAVKHDISATKHLIECKRYAEDRPVGVGEVRALYGVVTSQNASKGIIVTTSRLSRDSTKEVDKHPWRLGKNEFNDLKEWILDYLKRKSAQGHTGLG